MSDELNPLIMIGPAALLLGLVASIALAVFGLTRRSGDKARWLWRYVLGAAVVGIAALFVGAALGIGVFCSPANAGNLCGLGGVFGSGPLLAGIALVIHACRRTLGSSNK